MDERLKRIKELFAESEKRNGELAHENFELKKRIAELEEIDVVRCKDCRYRNSADLMCADARDDWFCADAIRKE